LWPRFGFLKKRGFLLLGVKMEESYPYVVIRYIPAVYGQLPVRFVDPGTPHDSSDAFVIPCALPHVDGNLTLATRESLVQAVLTESKKSGHKTCVVFGESDCVFCNPDGSTVESNGPPQGGIQGIKFPLQTRSDEQN